MRQAGKRTQSHRGGAPGCGLSVRPARSATVGPSPAEAVSAADSKAGGRAKRSTESRDRRRQARHEHRPVLASEGRTPPGPGGARAAAIASRTPWGLERGCEKNVVAPHGRALPVSAAANGG